MQSAEKISITMTPEMLRIIRESVDAGEFASTSEVLRDAMRLWLRKRAEDAARLKVIQARIRYSLDDPRPDLAEEEADAVLDAMFDRIDDEFGHAKP
jgi:antitoxin ParD1/3/4